MHARLETIAKKLRHAEMLATTCAINIEKRFFSDHPYRICFTRLRNKAQYAAEIIDFYADCLPADRELDVDQVERVIETEKWFFVAVLSVIEYSMPSLLGERGTDKLRAVASNGPFSSFLERAESENAIDANERSLLEFASKVRNDLIHRNGVSRANAKMIFQQINFNLIKDEMIEGHWGMLTDLGTLAIYSVAGIIEDIESNLHCEAQG